MVKVKWDNHKDDDKDCMKKVKNSEERDSTETNALNPRAEKPGGVSSTSPGNITMKEAERNRKEYFENYIVTAEDVGNNLFALIKKAEKSADTTTELSPIEKKYLDDLIFKGFVVHEIFIKEGFPVTFRSIPAIANLRGYDILANEKGIGRKAETLGTIMALSVYLESYGNPGQGISFSHKGQSQEDFIKEEKIRERFEFCRDSLSGILVDALNKRLVDFLNVLGRISLSENIVNFSSAP